MEKAKIINIRKSKNGDLTVEIQLEDGKVIHVPATTILDESLNNEECIIERRNRSIISITVKGRKIFSPQRANDFKTNKQQTTTDKHRNNHAKIAKESKAHAPYNFIPLNNEVVPGQDCPDFDRYHSKPVSETDPERFNGYIDCHLETITPLYIRDAYTNEEIVKREPSGKNSAKNGNPDFFSPGGTAKIPGSSLRGMIRTLVEIMSWGKFGFTDSDRKLFFRAVGDTSTLGKYYRQIMIDEQNGYFPKIKAGILKKVDNKYLIYKSKTFQGTQIYRVNFDPTTRKMKNTDIALEQFDFKKVYFKPVAPKLYPHKRPKNLKYALVEEISDQKKEGYIEGYLISSGNLGKRKHMHWIINMPGSDYEDITESIKVYLQDENREEKANLLNMLQHNLDGVPCFYIKTESGETALGHTGMFRLPYKYTIGDHIPGYLKQEGHDMAEKIFGVEANKESLASRVFFEDALLDRNQKDIFVSDKPLTTQILSGPKPTTFQHYLEQGDNAHIKNLNHWNTEGTNIRGHKLYWHRDIRDSRDWEYNENEEQRKKDGKQLTQIKPIKPGIEFTFRIRFENLTKEELGAMLFAIDLPNGCHHKLGMGKPLGLGSVNIKPKLLVIDREKRYTRLFQGDAWNLGDNQEETKSFKDAFEQYVLSHIKTDSKTMTSIWDYERMQHLKTMLNWDNTKVENWHEETKYMTIEPLNEFKNRPVLLRPTEEYDSITKES